MGGTAPNPWRRLAENWPTVEVRFVDLGTQWELTCWEKPVTVIYLHEKLTQVQRRASVAHACEHLARGAPHQSVRFRVEREVVHATSVYLLPDIETIADAIAVYDLRRAAEELWVPFGILADRLRLLTDAELEYVAQRGRFVGDCGV